jgi:hypothetical protein
MPNFSDEESARLRAMSVDSVVDDLLRRGGGRWQFAMQVAMAVVRRASRRLRTGEGHAIRACEPIRTIAELLEDSGR